MRKNQVILIYGVPASGKYTMAKRLSQKQGFLLDNHYFHDMFKDLIDVPENKKNQYFEDIGELKQAFVKIIQHFYPQKDFIRYIFTSCLAESEKDKLLRLREFAKSIHADFIPIELTANMDILKARCQTEQRKHRKKICNPKTLERVIAEIFSKSPDFEDENKILIDTSFLSEDATFEIIETHLKKFQR